MTTRWNNFFYRKQVWKTTWKLRLLVALGLIAIVVLPWSFWTRQIGRSLVCNGQVEASDALLLENFDVNYQVFVRAADLQKAGLAPRVFVPMLVTADPSGLNVAAKRVIEVVAQSAHLDSFDLIPVYEKEPISQNASFQIREFLKKENIRSVIVITPGFRSRRSAMVYNSAFGPQGIRVGCSPVFEKVDAETWTSTWHGMQQVLEQFLKLQYYRFYVLM